MPNQSERGYDRSITEGARSLALFQDRFNLVERFTDYLNEDPASDQILFLHGEGGIGKSLLLRYLSTHSCKRMAREEWKRARKLPQEQKIAEVMTTSHFASIPKVLIDFALPPQGEDRPRESLSALRMIRRDLASTPLLFPVFDFACLWHLHATHRLTKDSVRELFPSEARSLISELVSVLTESSRAAKGVTHILDILQRRLGKSYILYRAKRRLAETDIERIMEQDPRTELIRELPIHLAKDLNASMELKDAPQRVALLFDSHEALWAGGRNTSNDLYFERDEWLRKFVGEVDRRSGLVAVVSGREPPRWMDAPRAPIPIDAVDLQQVSPISERFAVNYLRSAGVVDESILEMLVNRASIQPDEVHPLYLGLCADTMLLGKRDGRNAPDHELELARTGRAIVDMFLRDADRETEVAARSLCACRAFDLDLFLLLGHELHFDTSRSRFETLIDYSFVAKSPSDETRYRIHELVRSLEHEADSKEVLRAHSVLEKYYRDQSKGDVVATAEAIYHLSFLESDQAAIEYTSVLEQLVQDGRFEFCPTLIALKTDMNVESMAREASILVTVGTYFTAVSLVDEALDAYQQAYEAAKAVRTTAGDYRAARILMADALHLRGEALSDTDRLVEAETSLKASIDAYDAAAELLAPEAQGPSFSVSCGCADARRTLADLIAKNRLFAPARAYYQAAILGYDEALLIAQACDREDLARKFMAQARTNRGNALVCFGELEAETRNPLGAVTRMLEAIREYEKAYEAIPAATTWHNWAFALVRVGELRVRQGQMNEATDSYLQAISMLNRLLDWAPEHVQAYNSRGIALMRLGELQIQPNQTVAFLAYMRAALSSFESALDLAPGFSKAQNNRTVVLKYLEET